MNAIIRVVTTLAGLAGLGIIVHEVLKKWQWFDGGRSILWTIAPLWNLFICKETATATYFQERFKLSPRVAGALKATLNGILIVLAILALVSIPFLWFGIIEELAKGGGGSR